MSDARMRYFDLPPGDLVIRDCYVYEPPPIRWWQVRRRWRAWRDARLIAYLVKHSASPRRNANGP